MNQEGGEKTEKASPKKRKDSRKKGQVRKSNEVNVAFCAAVMFGFLLIYFPYFFENLGELMAEYFGEAYLITAVRDFNFSVAIEVFSQLIFEFILLMLPLLGVALVAGVVINIIQVGFLFTTKPLMPKLERISPIQGFKRIFSTRTVVELVKSILKVILLGYILYREYRKMIDFFPTLMGVNIYLAFIDIMTRIFIIALEMCMALVVVAAFDFLYQWWKHEKDLKMTKQEVKDEYKNTEGDPQIKNQIRQKQRQMSAMRMMEAVPSADVVITNPTHYAVALKYDQAEGFAPRVVAKGTDHLARKIKDLARESGVELVENVPLARGLFAMCEVGDEIPTEFYQAVADILVYVYRLKDKQTARPNGAGPV